ncbi:MAG TPA: hypothetical protein RMH99_02705 [Sandaracinaceae bacterium LLY-WYZ-13_1]|nr:hypothetical protein [Sandaracinaceae bacterium LLY-WYZ-13_1]
MSGRYASRDAFATRPPTSEAAMEDPFGRTALDPPRVLDPVPDAGMRCARALSPGGARSSSTSVQARWPGRIALLLTVALAATAGAFLGFWLGSGGQ